MSRLYVGIAALAILALTGCQKNSATVTAQESEAYQPLERMDTASESTQYETDPYASDPYASDPLVSRPEPIRAPVVPADPVIARPPAPVVREETLIASEEPTGPRTHVVRKGDTLYSLARHYYSKQSKWKSIWEANRARVPNPDKLKIGTKLIIP